MSKRLQLLILIVFLCYMASCSPGGAPMSDEERAVMNSEISEATFVDLPEAFQAGVTFRNGVQPGDASNCEAPAGRRCWYVDASVADGGDGSFSSPYNSFEQVAGYMQGSNYHQGALVGGDYLYVKGTFRASQHDPVANSMTILLARAAQGGTPQRPTVIKSWPGHPRAIFDGEHQLGNMIFIRSVGQTNNGVKVENIEVTRASSVGIHIGDHVAWADINNVVVHDGIGDGMSGTGGAVLFRVLDSHHTFSLRNSLIYSNRHKPKGSENNIGGVSILAEPAAKEGSSVTISNNIIRDEVRAVRHKHSGPIKTVVINNVIADSTTGAMLRCPDNVVKGNLMVNLEEAIIHYSGNQIADINTVLSGNTIIDSQRLFYQVGSSDFHSRVHASYNLFQSDASGDGIIVLGRWSSIPFRVEDWKSEHNVFYFDEIKSKFIFHTGKPIHFSDGLDLISDSSSLFSRAEFVDPSNLDFRPLPLSELELVPGAFATVKVAE